MAVVDAGSRELGHVVHLDVLVKPLEDSVGVAGDEAAPGPTRTIHVLLKDPHAYCAHPVFERFDHIGVAVEDLDEALALYGERFGMELQHRETVEEQGVEAVLLGVGDSHIELLRPLGPDTAVGKFLARSGPGLHHVAYGTDDIDSALESVRAAGLELIDERPRVGMRGSRVAFLHPKSTGGVLTELVEAPEGH